MTSTYTRLRDGTWGVRISHGPSDSIPELRRGLRVPVTKRDGTIRHAVLDELVARFVDTKAPGDIIELWSIIDTRRPRPAEPLRPLRPDPSLPVVNGEDSNFNAEQAAKAAALAAERADMPEGVIWVEEEEKRTDLPW